ncbi:MAG: DUF1338 family protein [Phenylobacterium sp.]|uniref:2-oxoadipate dioxygenase/decarboxylase family protein n=1 Tax=Phenylobacterium sp. TaxID=1871053 RepID=UPI0027359367|nr:DUF1338 family protein [Phenylobacterium sp.]MDP3172826.1 DUF1338 family protein [Phenylobacterium sp.]
MQEVRDTVLRRLLRSVDPAPEVSALVDQIQLDPAFAEANDTDVSRAVLAQALNILLLKDLLDRVPTARLYMQDLSAAGRQLVFDHGALRTVELAGMGSLPSGEAALTRILLPLGYFCNEVYPLDRLGMTGRSYAHADFPETVPQFFLSELHVERFSPAFQAATARITQGSVDPLDDADRARLEALSKAGRLSFADACALLPKMVACFARQHPAPARADYEVVLAESAEMAWIATEGNAFNHATDRVSSVEALAGAQRDMGRPMKETIEVSATGRIRQTAYRADPIVRVFVDAAGRHVEQPTPGSFFEFIQRERVPGSGKLDLSFDSGNAQGIFKMTSAAAS